MRIFTSLMALVLCGCAERREIHSKAATLHPAMTQEEVRAVMGAPKDVDSKAPGMEFHREWGGGKIIRRPDQQLIWHYPADLECRFQWSYDAWRLVTWDFEG